MPNQVRPASRRLDITKSSPVQPLPSSEGRYALRLPPVLMRFRRRPPVGPIGPLLVVVCLVLAASAIPAYAQASPWGQAAVRMEQEFTGPIARGFSLVAIVVGGLTMAFSEGGGRRTIGGLIFGLGLAMGATQFVTWIS